MRSISRAVGGFSCSSARITSGTELFDNFEVEVNGASQSSTVSIAGLRKITYTGTGGFDATGHPIALMGYAVTNAPSQTASLVISTEGKSEVLAGTVTSSVAVQGGLANVASGATVTTQANFNSSLSANSGTISNLNHFRANAPAAGTAPVNIIGMNVLDQAGSSSTVGFYGQLTAGTGKFNIAIPSGGAPIMVGAAANTGNGSLVQITGAGGLELATDRGVIFTGQTSSAAAQVATLTNSPAAGNPAFWLRCKVNGTNGAIPVWLG